MIDGYEPLQGGDQCTILISPEVSDFLRKNLKTNSKHTRRVYNILIRLSEYGLEGVPNGENFKREEKLSTGAKGGERIAVYAVKAFQLRIYGGFLNIKGNLCFVCEKADKKKKDKADRDMLERVAKALGQHNG